jgi:hypothetical protein
MKQSGNGKDEKLIENFNRKTEGGEHLGDEDTDYG